MGENIILMAVITCVALKLQEFKQDCASCMVHLSRSDIDILSECC